jgi:hypothetical protein
MPYDIDLEPSEDLLARYTFAPGSRSEALNIAISDHAIFLPRKKHHSFPDPYDLVVMGGMFLSPMIINAVLLLRHQSLLQTATIRTSAGTR